MPTLEQEIRRGESLYTAGRLQEALEVFAGILQNDPRNTFALNDAALVLADLDEVVAAATLLERALAADPANENAFFNLLDLLRGQGDAKLVHEAFEQYGPGIVESAEKARYRQAFQIHAQARRADDGPAAQHRPDRTILVTGMPRSGTGLVAALVNAIPEAVRFDDAPAAIETLGARLAAMARPDDDDALVGLTLDVTALAHIEALAGAGFRIVAVVRNPVYAIGAWNAASAPRLPESCVTEPDVHPRHAEVAWASDDPIERQAQLWQEFASKLWAWRDAVRLYTYEQLVREPASVLEDLTTWLGATMPREIPTFTNRNDERCYPDLDRVRAAVARYTPLRKVFGYAEPPRRVDPVFAGDGVGDGHVQLAVPTIDPSSAA